MTIPAFAPRVLESSSTTGTGSYTVAGAVTGDQTFAAGVANGAVVDYFANDQTGAWEEGQGTLSSSNTVLSRAIIYGSSNSGSAVNWTAGQNLRVGLTISSNYAKNCINNNGTVLTPNGVLYGTGDAVAAATAAGTTGQVLIGNTGSAPSWSGSLSLSGTISASNFSGSSSGTNTGDQTSVSGNAGTATALASARTLWGQSFDGTANVTGSLTAVGDITGGASSMTITAGTGNSRTLTFKTTTSGGVATTALTLADDQSVVCATHAHVTTWLRVGSASALSGMTTAGDLSISRLSVGGTAVGTDSVMDIAGTMTSTSANTNLINGISTLSPAGDSTSDFRTFNMSARPATNQNFNTIRAGFFEVRPTGSTVGNITQTNGVFCDALAFGSATVSAGTIADSRAFQGRSVSSSGAATGTVTRGVTFYASAPTLGSGPVVLTGQAAFMSESLTGATNNSYIVLARTTIPSGQWGIFNASTNTNHINGTILLGTTTLPSGATFNFCLGGGSTSPVLGAATADIVSLAAVDNTAGHRRFYIQSEAGSAINLGDDTLDFAAAATISTQAGTLTLSPKTLLAIQPNQLANGQRVNIDSLTELTTVAAAATTDTTIQLPANAVILAVTVRTTVVIPTATSYSVGDSGSATRFNTANVGVAANSTDVGTKAGAYYNATATSVRLTMNGGTPAANTGRVRVTILYYSVTAPTS